MKYDVVVVGAGPAGSTVSKKLSDKGFNVLLIDKQKFPRDKPCGGGIPFKVFKKFNYVKDMSSIESFCYGGIAYSSSLKHKAKIVKSRPIGAMVFRQKFDYELISIAKNSSVEFQQNKKLTDFKISHDKAKLCFKNGDIINSKVIIGADGMWSVVAKKAGLSKKRNIKSICILSEFEVNSKVLDDYFTHKRICHFHSLFKGINGYGWVFPKKEHLNIGLYDIRNVSDDKSKNVNLLNLFKEYIAFLKMEKIIPNDIKIKGKIIGGSIPVYPLDKTYSNRLLLVGDAGGFINPISGEGIYYAMWTGDIASKVVCGSLENEQFSDHYFSSYQDHWMKEIGEDIKILTDLMRGEKTGLHENIIKFAGKDKVLGDILLGIMLGDKSIKKYKSKIMRRYILDWIRYKFSK